MSEKPMSFLEELEVAGRNIARAGIEATGTHARRRFKDEYVNLSYSKQDGTPLTAEEYEELLSEDERKAEDRKNYRYRDMEIRKRQHVRVMTDKVKEAAHQMNAGTLGTMMMILGEVNWSKEEDTKGMLMNEEGRPMKMKDLEELFGKSRRVTTTIIRTLKDAGFLRAEGETVSTVYFVNPEFHVMGTSVDKGNFVRLYNKDLKQLTKETRVIEGKARRISPDALGFFYMLMPYIHMNMNAIVHNPNEMERNNVKLALKTELHDLVGVDRKTVSKYMKELNHFGVLATLEIYGKKSIIPNPKYLYRGDDTGVHRSIMDGMERRDKE